MKIARCKSCGRKMSQIWNERANCDNCGGPVDQVEVDMGFMDKVPRLLNVGGVALMIFAVLYFIYKISSNGLGKTGGTDIIILFTAGIGFFALSLVAMIAINSQAKEKVTDDVDRRKQRKVKKQPQQEKGSVRSGPVEPSARRTASKVPLRDR